MSDVFDVLKVDHERLERTVAQLEDRAPGEGQLAEGLVIENLKHEAAEQIHLWPAVRERLSDGDLLADLGLSQEGDGKRLLADLHSDGGACAPGMVGEIWWGAVPSTPVHPGASEPGQ
jgi:hypothetical protein